MARNLWHTRPATTTQPALYTVSPTPPPPASGGPTTGKSLVFSDPFTSIQIPSVWGYLSESYPTPGTKNGNDHKLDLVQQAQDTSNGANGIITAAWDSTNTVTTPLGTFNCWDTGLLTTGQSYSTGGGNFQAQAGDFIAMQINLPSATGAWPAFWTWGSGSYAGHGELDIFEYHPDNPNLLECTNHMAATINPSANQGGTYYTNTSIVVPGSYFWVGATAGATNVQWWIGNGVDETTMTNFYSDGQGVGAGWTANLIINMSISDGKFHPAPANHTGFFFDFKNCHVWR